MTPQDFAMLDLLVPSLLQQGLLAEAGALIGRVVQRAAEAQGALPRLRRNLVVTGPPRVGKSLLAAAIAARTGALCINADRFRVWYLDLADAAAREAARRAVFEAVLAAAPGCVILDGDEFISSNRDSSTGPHPLGLARLSAWQARGLADVVILGCPDSTPDDKAAGMRRWRAAGQCWTLDHPAYADDARLNELAYGIITTSHQLRALAAAAGLTFLPVADGDFAATIDRAAARIARGGAAP